MANRLSYNIHAQGVKDTPRLLAHLAKLKPTWAGVMNGVGLAQEIRKASPNTQVWHRAYPEGGDETIWQRLSPGEWVTRTATELKDTGLWAYCLNEPGFDDEMLIWLCSVIELAQPLGLKLVVGNFSVGTPEPNQWNKASARRLLELCDKYRATVALGLHEYAGGVITSGFVGGAPNSTQYHPDYIPVANWPSAAEARDMTMWHVGRVKFLVNACKQMNIQPPRVLITEFGFDSLKSDPNPDLRAWLDNLPTENGLEARAWKGLRAAWAKFFDTLAHGEAYYRQLAYADCIIYHDALPVEGMQIFCYGAKGNDWIHFDVEGYDALHKLLELHECEKSATANKPNEPPAPVELPELPTLPALPELPQLPELPELPLDKAKMTDVYSCARCGTDHEEVEFKRFKRPIVYNNVATWNWWATCPVTGDPIIMRVTEPSDTAPPDDEDEQDTPVTPVPSLERRALFSVLAAIGRQRTELLSYYTVVDAELNALQELVQTALKSQ